MNKEIEQIEKEWQKYVEDIYYLNEEFDLKKTKKIVKSLQKFLMKLEKKEKDTKITLTKTDFHDQQEIEKELKELITYIKNKLEFLDNIVSLEPKTPRGYSNYIKNAVGFFNQ